MRKGLDRKEGGRETWRDIRIERVRERKKEEKRKGWEKKRRG